MGVLLGTRVGHTRHEEVVADCHIGHHPLAVAVVETGTLAQQLGVEESAHGTAGLEVADHSRRRLETSICEDQHPAGADHIAHSPRAFDGALSEEGLDLLCRP